MRGEASTEEATRKVSMMTSMNIGLCKRRLRYKSTRWGSSLGGREWDSLVVVLQRAREGPRCPLSDSSRREVVAPRGSWFSACLCSSLTCTGHLRFPWDDVLLHHFLRAVVGRLNQCHRDREPLALCPSTESSLPATPRCATASAFVWHDHHKADSAC